MPAHVPFSSTRALVMPLSANVAVELTLGEPLTIEAPFWPLAVAEPLSTIVIEVGDAGRTSGAGAAGEVMPGFAVENSELPNASDGLDCGNVSPAPVVADLMVMMLPLPSRT